MAMFRETSDFCWTCGNYGFWSEQIDGEKYRTVYCKCPKGDIARGWANKDSGVDG